MGDRDAAARCPRDRCRTGVGLQRTRVAESGPVVTDLRQYSGGARFAEPREADKDLVVGVLLECRRDCLSEPVDVVACGVQDGEQRQGLNAYGLLDQRRLSELGPSERLLQVGGGRVDTALSAGSAQRGRNLGFRQPGAGGWRRRDRQHCSGEWRRQVGGAACERFEK